MPRFSDRGETEDLKFSAGDSLNARKGQYARTPKPTALERYYSADHSFPDYGSRKGAYKMPGGSDLSFDEMKKYNGRDVLRKINGAGRGGHNNLHDERSSAPKRPPTSDILPPPAKRSKKSANDFLGLNGTGSTSRPKLLSPDSRQDSESSNTASPSDRQTNGVPEFRSMEMQMNSRSHRRSRGPRSKPSTPECAATAAAVRTPFPASHFASIINAEDIDMEADELGHENLARGLPQNLQCAQQGNVGQNRGKRTISRLLSHSSTVGSKRRRDEAPEERNEEPDELSGNPPRDFLPHPWKQGRQSDKIVTSRDLKQTRWKHAGQCTTANSQPNAIRISAACAQTRFYYDSLDDNLDVQNSVFVVLENNGIRVSGGEVSVQKYDWLNTSIDRISKIQYHEESSVIYVNRRGSPLQGTGAQLYFQVSDKAALRQFSTWVDRLVAVTMLNGSCISRSPNLERHEKAWRKAFQDISRQPALHERSREHLRASEDFRGLRDQSANASSQGTISSRQGRSPLEARHESGGTMRGMIPAASSTRRILTRVSQLHEVSSDDDKDAFALSATTVPRWTQQNLSWEKEWKVPVVFERATVDKQDIERLDEGEFLNDNLINFGLRYFFSQAQKAYPQLKDKVFIHNSYFYEKLRGKGKIDFNGVRSWTSKQDILACDYILVPINENLHWYLAIICNPGSLDPGAAFPVPTKECDAKKETVSDEIHELKAQAKEPHAEPNVHEPWVACDKGWRPAPMASACPSVAASLSQLSLDSSWGEKAGDGVDDENEAVNTTKQTASMLSAVQDGQIGRKNKKVRPGIQPRQPDCTVTRIITLDSMDGSHFRTCGNLKLYLIAEFQDKRKTTIEDTSGSLGMRAQNIPRQDNFCDCGVYLLGYVREFLRDPDAASRALILKQKWMEEGFSAPDLRNFLRAKLFELQKMRQAEVKQANQRKKAKAISTPSKNENAGMISLPQSTPVTPSTRETRPPKSKWSPQRIASPPLTKSATPFLHKDTWPQVNTCASGIHKPTNAHQSSVCTMKSNNLGQSKHVSSSTIQSPPHLIQRRTNTENGDRLSSFRQDFKDYLGELATSQGSKRCEAALAKRDDMDHWLSEATPPAKKARGQKTTPKSLPQNHRTQAHSRVAVVATSAKHSAPNRLGQDDPPHKPPILRSIEMGHSGNAQDAMLTLPERTMQRPLSSLVGGQSTPKKPTDAEGLQAIPSSPETKSKWVARGTAFIAGWFSGSRADSGQSCEARSKTRTKSVTPEQTSSVTDQHRSEHPSQPANPARTETVDLTEDDEV